MLTAMPREGRSLAHALRLSPVDLGCSAAWRDARTVVAAVGVGTVASRRAAERVLDAVRADSVLVMGVAGAVAPSLGVADLVVPEVVVDASSGRRFQPHGGAVVRRGVLATVRRFGDPVPEGTWAVDMETAALADLCEGRGVLWDVRRAVSDVPGTVGPAVASLVRPDGRADGSAVARLLLRRPGQVATLARVGRDTARAVAAVTRAVLAEIDS